MNNMHIIEMWFEIIVFLWSNFVVSPVCTYALALLGTRASAGTVTTNLWSHLSKTLALTGFKHCSLVMIYGDNDLRQHRFRQWLLAWQQQAIAWSKADLLLIGSLETNFNEVWIQIE